MRSIERPALTARLFFALDCPFVPSFAALVAAGGPLSHAEEIVAPTPVTVLAAASAFAALRVDSLSAEALAHAEACVAAAVAAASAAGSAGAKNNGRGTCVPEAHAVVRLLTGRRAASIALDAAALRSGGEPAPAAGGEGLAGQGADAGAEPPPRGCSLFPSPVAQLACARLLRACAAVAAADAAAICIPAIERLSLRSRHGTAHNDGGGAAGDERRTVPFSAPISGERGRALFAAAVCVGRWGELMRIAKDSEAVLEEAEAALTAARGAAATAQAAAEAALGRASAPPAGGGQSRAEAEGVNDGVVAHAMDPAFAGVLEETPWVVQWVAWQRFWWY